METPEKPLLRVLNGQSLSPPPLWLMRQAGRHLPEFRDIRSQADFLTRCMTPDLAMELTLQPVRRYGMDGAILFSDILILPWAMGQPLEFVSGRGPVMAPLRSEKGLSTLSAARAQEVCAPVLETLARLRAELGRSSASTALLGFAGAPFTVACYMVEGEGSREFAKTRAFMLENPAVFDRLMALLTEQTALYLCRQIEAGAEAVMLFDSWAGILPPFLFRDYVISPTQQIVSHIKARFADIPVIGFPRMAGLMVGEYATATGVQAVGLDTSVDVAQACRMIPRHVAIQGNLDPYLLLEGGTKMQREARLLCEGLQGRPHIFNLGHGVLPQTPPAHVEALLRTVRGG